MSTKKINIKKLVFAIVWVAIGIGTVTLLVAAVRGKNSKLCKGIDIDIHGINDNFFIDKNDVLTIINRFSGNSVKGKTIESFNLREMEASLEKDVWIKNAELYFDNNDVLQVSVEEREPIARIFTQGGNTYYIDSSAMMLPLSDKFSARVPVFTDFPSEAKVLSPADSSLLKDIRDISLDLQADNFLMAMIDQVNITSQRTFEMTPKIGDQVIVFGDAEDAEAKFSKLKLFYKKVIPHTGWNHYSSIDLQYNNQIVAKIKGKEDKTADSLKTLQLMKIMAENAAKASADSVQTFAPDNDKNTADSSMIQQSIQRDDEGVSGTAEGNENTETVAPTPAVVEKPKATIVKPLVTKMAPPAKPVTKSPEKKVAKKIAPKPVAKPEKRVPKAVMKANDY